MQSLAEWMPREAFAVVGDTPTNLDEQTNPATRKPDDTDTQVSGRSTRSRGNPDLSRRSAALAGRQLLRTEHRSSSHQVPMSDRTHSSRQVTRSFTNEDLPETVRVGNDDVRARRHHHLSDHRGNCAPTPSWAFTVGDRPRGPAQSARRATRRAIPRPPVTRHGFTRVCAALSRRHCGHRVYERLRGTTAPHRPSTTPSVTRRFDGLDARLTTATRVQFAAPAFRRRYCLFLTASRERVDFPLPTIGARSGGGSQRQPSVDLRRGSQMREPVAPANGRTP